MASSTASNQVSPPSRDALPSLSDELTSLNQLSEALLQRYNTSGPRYTSYPTAPMWKNSFGASDFVDAIRTDNSAEQGIGRPLSLYAHLPFCTSRCLFCGCNVIITQQREQAEKYLGYLFREIDQQSDLLAPGRDVAQFHWGGGTPTYLTPEQLTRLFEYQTKHVRWAQDAEIALEVDPRVTTDEQLVALRELGFNRISMGVQDFQPDTQEAIRRIQPVDLTEAMTERCRELGFGGINYDLIYGLPHQTETSFSKTLDDVIRLSPDRIALYNFAYIPWMAGHQTLLNPKTLPNGQSKFKIFKLAIHRLLEAGYVYMGMDHFAKPTDALTKAWQDGSLHRNFMGYTTHAGCDLMGVGVSAISTLHGTYSQNVKKLSRYYQAVDERQLPVDRGMILTEDDQLRRGAIHQVLCDGRFSHGTLSEQYGVDTKELFAQANDVLAQMAQDGLITELTEDGYTLTLLGRILSRNIAMLYDAYLKQPAAGSTSIVATSHRTEETVKNRDAASSPPPPMYSKTL